MVKSNKDPCKPFACAIQACLVENNFQEHKCSEVLERMRLCCLKWHKESLCCSGINLEKSYLQNPEVEINPKISRSSNK
ncbi:cx9C motif-containing protein 4 isoform X1 [Drosophila navojoa]|uniref:cx9C motif-containing protein 4 isoform X1 n=1 Tax=Drosophila navojoa TaxID=7232 RepID=UPI0008465E66|nr:cx9C motif-containing protein 4 isoform X1 [Drosophila navojoa]XP_017960190.1 cx9C motif-containing protein 4 isoform X1 [Drosophila navojoa]